MGVTYREDDNQTHTDNRRQILFLHAWAGIVITAFFILVSPHAFRNLKCIYENHHKAKHRKRTKQDNNPKNTFKSSMTGTTDSSVPHSQDSYHCIAPRRDTRPRAAIAAGGSYKYPNQSPKLTKERAKGGHTKRTKTQRW